MFIWREQSTAKSRTSMAENCPPDLARKLAQLLMLEDEDPDDMVDIFAENDGPDERDELQEREATHDKTEDNVKKNRDLRRRVGSQAMNYVIRLHKKLGHPAPQVLLRMLEEVQATRYVCEACYASRPPSSVPPAGGLMARNFNDRIVADSAWIDTKDGRKCVLTLLCQATR